MAYKLTFIDVYNQIKLFVLQMFTNNEMHIKSKNLNMANNKLTIIVEFIL